MAITLVDTADSGFKFGRLAYQAEVIQLASSFSVRLEGECVDENTDFEFLYDSVTSSPFIIYTIGQVAILAYSEVHYPEVLSVRDSAIWCFLADVALEVSTDMQNAVTDCLAMLHDDFFYRSGYKYAY